jgi:hypothetical protein
MGALFFDLDFERARRQLDQWLGWCPPEPRLYPEGLGPDDEYPARFLGAF